MADKRLLVDRLLAAPKSIVGEAVFCEMPGDDRCLRWRKACLIEGELPGMDLEVKAFPCSSELKFTIILVLQRAIWRLDFGGDLMHSNSLNRPTDLDSFVIGPHYHSWADNRRFSTAATLPYNLDNARPLDGKVRKFESAFRWFCAQVNIHIGEAENIPDLPARGRLL